MVRIFFIILMRLRIDYKLKIIWKNSDNQNKEISANYNIYNFGINSNKDNFVVEFPNLETNKDHPFPNNIIVFDANGKILHTVEFPFFDHQLINQKLIKVEETNKCDGKRFYPSPYNSSTSSTIFMRKNILIQFSSFTLEEKKKLEQLNIAVNIQSDIKCKFSCVGWEETRLFNLYEGKFSDAFNPEMLDGLYI